MKIPKEFPSFTTKSLLIVTGSQEALFYIGKQKVIEAIDDFRVEKPIFTDREGLFANSSGHGTLLQREAGYDNQAEKVKQDFTRKLENKLKSISNSQKISEIYIFSPAQVRDLIKNCLPPPLRDKVKLTVDGNFVRSHPIELLKKIQNQDKKIESLKENPVIGEEAAKILHQDEKVKV